MCTLLVQLFTCSSLELGYLFTLRLRLSDYVLVYSVCLITSMLSNFTSMLSYLPQIQASVLRNYNDFLVWNVSKFSQLCIIAHKGAVLGNHLQMASCDV